MRTLLIGTLRLTIAFALCYALLFVALFKVRVGGQALIYRTSELLRSKGGSTWSRFQEHDPAVYHDVVVIGSSHAYRGYDPRIFERRGYDLFNLGGTAQAPCNTWPVLKHTVRAGRVGLVIMDVYANIFANSGMESATDLVPNVDDDALAADVAWRVKDPRMINLLALRAARRNRPPSYLAKDYVGRGYCSRSDSVEQDITYRPLASGPPGAAQMDCLDRIIAHCAEAGIPLVLVTHPMPLAADTAGHARFARRLREHLVAAGPPYLDLATDHDLDARHHFYDHNHLNQAGVDRFNPRLIDTLEAMGLLRRASMSWVHDKDGQALN